MRLMRSCFSTILLVFSLSMALGAERLSLYGTIGNRPDNGIILELDQQKARGQVFSPLNKYVLTMSGAVDSTGYITLVESNSNMTLNLLRGKWTPDKQHFKGTLMLNKKTYPCQLTVAGQYTGIRNKAPGYIYDRIWPIINGNKPVIKQLNQAIFNESMNRLKSFQKENKDNHPDSTSVVSTFEYSNFNYVIHADNRLASILSLQYWYSGGAHGMTSFNGESYILKGNKPVRLDLKTIFLPKTDYMEKLVSIVKEDIGKQRVGVTDAQKIPDISGKDLQTFTISTGGITFYFDPYAVGSYAEGYYSSYLSWDKLSEIINPKGPVGYLLPKK